MRSVANSLRLQVSHSDRDQVALLPSGSLLMRTPAKLPIAGDRQMGPSQIGITNSRSIARLAARDQDQSNQEALQISSGLFSVASPFGPFEQRSYSRPGRTEGRR